jgi:host factor-I protein
MRYYHRELIRKLDKHERMSEKMQKNINLQDLFLNQARKNKMPLTMFLMNGFQLRGIVTGFDNFTVVLDTEGKQQLIYKHAISTIIPVHAINFYDAEEDNS